MTTGVPDEPDERLLEALLDSWDRNNIILVNLLRALPDGALDVRAIEGSPTVGQLFTHIHYVRLVFVVEDAPEFGSGFSARSARLGTPSGSQGEQDSPPEPHGGPMPEGEWRAERDRDRLAAMLNESATVVREAVRGRLLAGRDMDRHYDHPILMLQHMIWHEGYHHGQIKLAVKAAGRPFDDEEIGPLTWDVWMSKTATGSR